MIIHDYERARVAVAWLLILIVPTPFFGEGEIALRIFAIAVGLGPWMLFWLWQGGGFAWHEASIRGRTIYAVTTRRVLFFDPTPASWRVIWRELEHLDLRAPRMNRRGGTIFFGAIPSTWKQILPRGVGGWTGAGVHPWEFFARSFELGPEVRKVHALIEAAKERRIAALAAEGAPIGGAPQFWHGGR